MVCTRDKGKRYVERGRWINIDERKIVGKTKEKEVWIHSVVKEDLNAIGMNDMIQDRQ